MKWILILGLGGYCVLAAGMYLAQRSLMYFPDPVRRAPQAHGLPQGEEVEIKADDGARLTVWHVPPQEGRPVVVYFQGNAGGLDLRARRFGRIAGEGLGLVALNYRGYGGSGGKPTELGLILDGYAAHAFAAGRYGTDRIVLWGESLGTGVAVAVAATRPVARVLLESPYTSTADVAAAIYWYLPVRLLMLDQFRSDERIGKVTAPVLVLHGARDTVIPIRFGERLYGMIHSEKRFVRMADAAHNDHDERGGFDLIKSFLKGE